MKGDKTRLAMARKKGEFIALILPDGDEIFVCVDELTKRSVRLSIKADQSVQIWRGELLDEHGIPPVRQ